MSISVALPARAQAWHPDASRRSTATSSAALRVKAVRQWCVAQSRVLVAFHPRALTPSALKHVCASGLYVLIATLTPRKYGIQRQIMFCVPSPRRSRSTLTAFPVIIAVFPFVASRSYH